MSNEEITGPLKRQSQSNAPESKKVPGLKIWKYALIMITGMLVAAVPGFLEAPYSINQFDEPYQIINAMEWPTSVYSPLSSWLANKFGILVEWKYLAFRYLGTSLNFIAIVICSLYALHVSKRKALIVVSSIVVTLLALSFRTSTGYYGWDNWTALFLSVSLVLFLSLVRSFSWGKLILLGMVSAIISLVRISNVTIIFFCALILFVAFKSHRERYWVTGCYVFTALSCLYILLGLLYGNVGLYQSTFSAYEIGDHSALQMLIPLFSGFIIALLYALGFFLSFKGISILNKMESGMRLLLYIVLIVVFVLSLLPSRGVSFGMGPAFCSGLMLMSLLMLLREARRKTDFKLAVEVTGIFLLSLTAAVGSNGGYSKALTWPVFPLIFWLLGREFKWSLCHLYICCSVAYLVYSVIGFTQHGFFDENPSLLTFQFKDRESVLYGMRTNPERGKFISGIYEDVETYLSKGYAPIVLKQGNDYIFEYMLKAPNLLQRHNFGNWYAFWDKEYVLSIEKEINASKSPVCVLYRQWKDLENPNPMMEMLEANTRCVIDKPGYSVWIKE